MKYVSVGRRFLAILVDWIVLALPVWILAGSFGQRTVDTTNGANVSVSFTGPNTFLPVVLYIGYYFVMEGLWGASVGKFVTGIRAVMEDGSKLTWGASFVRNLLRVVDGLFFYLVGAILVWNSPTRQRLGDRAGKTVVVEKASIGQPPSTGQMGQPQPGQPAPPPPPAPTG